MVFVPPERHLLRAKDFVDRNYAAEISVEDMAAAAGFSKAHFTREFHLAFGETPRAYLLTRRLERAASLLRSTDWTVLRICTAVGLRSQGSFTTSFTRMYGSSPTAYRAAHPSARSRAMLPTCVQLAHGRPRHRTFREDPAPGSSYSDGSPQSGQPRTKE